MDCSKATRAKPGAQTVALAVADEFPHHYAEAILVQHPEIRNDIVEMFQNAKQVSFETTAGGRLGLKTSGPNGINKRLRKELVHAGSWRSEVGWTDAFGESVWLFQPDDRLLTGSNADEKFDLALLDECECARSYWNLLVESHRLDTLQLAELKRIAPKHIQAHWSHCLRAAVTSAAQLPQAINLIQSLNWTARSFGDLIPTAKILPRLDSPPNRPLVLGEIQFGNWALAYRDVGRILAVRQKFKRSPVSLFIMVAPTGCMSRQISSGTVNFERYRTVLQRVGNDLPVPTWLVGLDYDHSAGAPPHPAP